MAKLSDMSNNVAPFKVMEGTFVIIKQRGVVKQLPLYERQGYLYAKIAGGYILLMNDGTTSKDQVSWNGTGGIKVEFMQTECWGGVRIESEKDSERWKLDE